MEETTPRCARCGGTRVQHNRVRLSAVGIVFIAVSLVLPPYGGWLMVSAVFGVLAGGYLLVWSSVGKGRWCRTCKTF